MSDFWRFAGQMLRYRGTIVLSMVGALVAALCFGAGIGTVPIILNAMLGDKSHTLQQLARDADARLGDAIPDAWVANLPSDPFKGILLVLLVVLVLTAVGAAAKFCHTYLAMSAAIRTIADIRRASFTHIIHLPMRTVVTEGAIDQISRIVRDSNQLRNGFVAILGKAIGESLKAAAALGIAFWLSWQLSLIALIGTPVLAVTIKQFSRKVQRASRRTLIQSANLLGMIIQSVQGIRVVKVHTAEEHEAARFDEVNTRLLAEELSMRQAKALASPVVEGMTMIGVVMIGALASWYIIRSGVDSSTVLGTLLALGAAGAAVRPLTQLSTDVHESSAAAERIAELLGKVVEQSTGKEAPVLPTHRKSISFVGVRLQYDGANDWALDGVDLRIRAGETVAIVGPNGSGKTSLLSLIPRLFDPTQGQVLIDDCDISSVSLRSLRHQIGVVPQETIIFNDTIASNIAYGMEHLDNEDLRGAARRAHADEFIRSKPRGYDTIVGEQGATLSGGERQRLAIARAILRDPRILILDEAMSMIDADSEAMITAALRDFCRDRTSLVIAHRLSTVIGADRIIVMDKGRIVDKGNHEQLLESCGLYRQLCRTQLASASRSAGAEAGGRRQPTQQRAERPDGHQDGPDGPDTSRRSVLEAKGGSSSSRSST